jgi:peptidoglycan hydrolase CwlO-like protein
METINLELRELQQKYSALSDKYAELSTNLAKTQGEVSEIKRVSTSFAQQTIWQLLGFAVVMASVMLSGLYFQTNALRNESNARFEKLEQRITNAENNLNARFEDLKQEVRANRK